MFGFAGEKSDNGDFNVGVLVIGGSGERLREEESNIIRHDICQNVYTRADFDPVIFYPKACNL